MSAQEKVVKEALALIERKGDFRLKRQLETLFKMSLQQLEFAETISEFGASRASSDKVADLKYLEGLFDQDEFNAKNILTRSLKMVNNEANVEVLQTQYGTMWNLVSKIMNVLTDFNLEQKKRKVLGAYPTPTGQKTRLTAKEQLQVREELFRSWFGDWIVAANTGDYNGVSKLVDEATKEPMVLFHGTGLTKDPFTMFRVDRTMTPGIYLSDDYEYAEWFAQNDANRTDRKSGGTLPYIYSTFVQMVNPLDFRGLGLNKLKGQDVLDVIYVTTGYEVQDKTILNYGDKEAFLWVWMRQVPTMIAELRDNTEFDGILFEAFNPSFLKDPSQGIPKLGLEVLAFYPEQVKLTDAVLFSGLVDDVRFKEGGKISKS
jgi:hypothetical protein